MATAPEPSITYDRVVDAVDDLGMDNTGNTDISTTLENELTEGTKVEFPPGEYLWVDTVDTVTVNRTGIVGTGSNREDVQFVFPSGNSGATQPNEFYAWETRYADGVELRNITVQQTMDETTGVGMLLRCDDNLLVRDVHWDGFTPTQYEGPGRQLTTRIETQDGYGLVDNYFTEDGGPIGTYPDRSGGIFMGSAHQGEMRLINSDIRNLGSSAIYWTQHTGCARIEDCYFENNDNVNLRIDGGEHPTKDSWAKNIDIYLDWENFTGKSVPGGDAFNGAYDGFENMRGVLAESGGGANNTNLTLENITIDAPNVAKGTDALIEVRDNHGAVDATNVDISCQHEWPNKYLVWVEQTNTDVETPYECVFDDLTMVGSADVSEAVRIEGNRDGSIVRNSCLEMGGTCDGIGVYNSSNVTVEDTNVNVGGTPITENNTTVTRTNNTTTESCTFDGFGSGGGGTTGFNRGTQTTARGVVVTDRGRVI